MIKKTIRVGGLLCLCAIALIPQRSFVTPSAKAQTLVSAKVVASEGSVEIRREGTGKLQVQKVAFKVADELLAGDTIITGKDGRLVLGLSDGSQAVIAPKTTVIIKDLSQSPRTLFQMIKGKTRVHIEKLGGQPNPYRVNTPTAVIAVRGTIFDILADEDDTEVFLHEGQVEVFNQRLLNQPLLLNAGQMTRVGLQRMPSAPATFKVGRNDKLFQMIRSNNATGNTRIAERGNTGRGNPGGAAGNPGVGGPGSGGSEGNRPQAGRSGAPTPNPPRPNAEPRSGSRRPIN